MPAPKQTVLAYSLVAVVCLAVGFFAGQEYVKYEIRSAFQNAATTMSDAFNAPTSNGVTSSQSKTNAAKSEKSAAKAKKQAAKAQYIQQHLKLYDFHTKYMTSMLDGKVPGVTFKIKNEGNRTLNQVDVTVYFKNANGETISEASYTPVLVSEYSFGDDNKPLKAGYIWQMESGHFYSAKSVPSEWKSGSAIAKITDIKFAAANDGGAN